VKSSEIKYKKPAIIEAVFELRFESISNWEIGSFVKFAELAKQNGFPIMRDSPQQFQVVFNPNREPITNKAASHIQTWNEQETQLWQAGNSLYAANQREPYQGWQVFKPHILKGFELFEDVANPKIAEILTLRYINRLVLDEKEDPNSLFWLLPSGIKFSDNLLKFASKIEYGFENNERIVITCAKDISQETENAIILDILYVKPKPQLERIKLEKTIEKIHNRIVDKFENSIKDELRKKMEVL
jgi:uncharacterized protein (TIGR04255 family)